jgi:hypothetical protein
VLRQKTGLAWSSEGEEEEALMDEKRRRSVGEEQD